MKHQVRWDKIQSCSGDSTQSATPEARVIRCGGKPQECLVSSSVGLWWFVTPEAWQVPVTPVWLCHLCPIRRDGCLQAHGSVPVPSQKGDLHLSQFCKGGYCRDKKHCSTWQNLLLMSLFPYLAQNPACCQTEVSLSWWVHSTSVPELLLHN